MKSNATIPAFLAAGLVAALTLIAPATGADGPAATTTSSATTTATLEAGARDPISALSATSITVGPLTCSIGAGSPSVPFKVGDRVKIGCRGGVLVYVAADADVPAPTATTALVVTRNGTITAISERSLTVDGLTCSLGERSPSVAGFKIGDKVGIACQSNVLLKIVSAGGEPTPAPEIVTRFAEITALTDTSIIVDRLTCFLGERSPSVAGFKIGDKVGIACAGGVLVKIAASQTEERRDELQTRLGPITALSPTSITVDGLTCSIGERSPSVAGFKVGDKVGIGCANGMLVKIGIPQRDGDDRFKVAVQLGRIAVLSSDSITVGPLTCKLAATSPSVASYELGDHVGIGCAGGILFMIGALPNPDSVPKVEVKQALVQHFNGCIKRGAERCKVAGVLQRLVHKR